MSDLPDIYLRAQRAVAELKAAIVQLLQLHPSLTNAEIGRSLGIYHGHVGHEGHIPRTLLALLEEEGIAQQDQKSKRWNLKLPS
jgi:DNA-binding IclR family transcriptional regulator